MVAGLAAGPPPGVGPFVDGRVEPGGHHTGKPAGRPAAEARPASISRPPEARAASTAAQAPGMSWAGTPSARAMSFPVPVGTIPSGTVPKGMPDPASALTPRWTIPSPPTTTRASTPEASALSTARCQRVVAVLAQDQDLGPGGPEVRGRFVAGVQPAAKGRPRVDGNGDHHALNYASRREPSVPVRSFFP